MSIGEGVSVLSNAGYQNDMMDVARLFDGAAVSADAGVANGSAALIIEHRVLDEDGTWRDAFHIKDILVHEAVCDAVSGTALEAARARKRASKIALYELLKARTGYMPPWGSLTGIRPTRLYAEYLQEHPGAGAAEAEAHLRGVFDVSGRNAALLTEIWDMQAGIRHAPPGFCDIYIAIPFCATKCAYCAFPSERLTAKTPLDDYIGALTREMRGGAALLRERGFAPRNIYVGGGTPLSIGSDQLAYVLDAAGEAFGRVREYTVEAGRPDSIDVYGLRAMRERGVNRLSVNPQTMNDDTLARIGRAHTAADVPLALDLCRAEGFDNINMDIIAALPGEAPEDMARTLERIEPLNPESLTVHTLSVKRASRLMEEGYAQRYDGAAALMTRMAGDAARRMGMRPYYLYRQKHIADQLENIGYAKPGCASLYNIGMMEETVPVMAFGAGGVTKWLFDKERRIERVMAPKDIATYIGRAEALNEEKRRMMEG